MDARAAGLNLVLDSAPDVADAGLPSLADRVPVGVLNASDGILDLAVPSVLEHLAHALLADGKGGLLRQSGQWFNQTVEDGVLLQEHVVLLLSVQAVEVDRQVEHGVGEGESTDLESLESARWLVGARSRTQDSTYEAR